MGVYFLLQLVLPLSVSISDVMFKKLNNSTTYMMDIAIMKKMADVDVSFFDNPANNDSLVAARESETYISGNVTNVVFSIIQFFTLLSALTMFLSKNWIVGLIYLCTYIPGGILSFNQKKKYTSLIYQ